MERKDCFCDIFFADSLCNLRMDAVHSSQERNAIFGYFWGKARKMEEETC